MREKRVMTASANVDDAARNSSDEVYERDRMGQLARQREKERETGRTVDVGLCELDQVRREDFGHSANASRDDEQPCTSCFENANAKRFRQGWVEEDLSATEELWKEMLSVDGGKLKGSRRRTARTSSCLTCPRSSTLSLSSVWYLSRIWSSSTIFGPSPPSGGRVSYRRKERVKKHDVPMRKRTSGCRAQTLGRAAMRRSIPLR